MLKSFCKAALCGLLLIATAAMADSVVGISGMGNHSDAYSWSQLGDGTVVGSSVGLTSNTGYNGVATFAGPNSITITQCGSNPCWSGNFNSGDELVWTSAGDGTANGPINFGLGGSFSSVGAAVQVDAPGSFTAFISAFNGSTLLGTYSVTSDANGDVVYVGLNDLSGSNITSAIFGLSSCGGVDCDTRDFAMDQIEVTTPEPGSLALLGSGLLGLGGIIRRRR